MNAPPSGITGMAYWPIKVGEDRPLTLLFDPELNLGTETIPLELGTVTVHGGPAGSIDAIVVQDVADDDRIRVVVRWDVDDLPNLLLHQVEVRSDGLTFLTAPAGSAVPDNPGGAAEVYVPLNSSTIGVTVVLGAGSGSAGRTQATFTIPLVGQWNPPIITETGTGLTQNVFLIGCPVLPSFHPELELAAIEPPPSMPFMVEVAAPTTPPVDPPALPTVDDIPPAWTPIPGQEIEAADIYGILLYPLDYVALENQGVAMWIRGRSVDADGYETLIYLWFPNGIGPGITDVDVVVFAQGERFEHTVPAAADETTPGDPIDMTVVYRPTGSGAAAAALNVDARIAALDARIAALES